MKISTKSIVTSAFMGAALLVGMAQAAVSPTSVAGATTVDTATAKQLWEDGAAFLDTRQTSDWDAGHIPEAIHADQKNPGVYNPDYIADKTPRDAAIVCYCNGHSCLRSSKAAEDLVKWGFTKVYYYRDGFPAWKDAGNPVE